MFGTFPLARDYSYHALEHASHVLVALLGSKEQPDYKERLGRWARRQLNDQVESLIAQAWRECARQARAHAVEKELGYFVSNVERMQYGTFRGKGFFIGSGVIEPGCKTVIDARLARKIRGKCACILSLAR